MNSWKDQTVYVMGLGRFGGGVGITKYLAKQGATVIVGDSGDPSMLADSIAELQSLIDDQSVRLVIGTHDAADLADVDVLIANPAIPTPWKNPFLAYCRSHEIPIKTEIEIAYRQLDPSNIIAVTGTAGKSTTCAMIHHTLKALGISSVLGGNIGGSVLGELDTLKEDIIVVLELSSAMLYWLDESGVIQGQPPRVGCVTNCAANHLDWHGDQQHYEAAKRVLARYAEHLILGTGVDHWGDGKVVSQHDALCGCAVPGNHNGINAAMAVEAVMGIKTKVDREQATEAVLGFTGLPHRLRLVHECAGTRFYNDSKCTVPEASVLAVEAIGELVERSKIHLIAGGHDKGSDLSAVSEMSPELAGLYTIGATGHHLFEMTNGNAFDCNTLEHAMKLIDQRLSDGDVVLLSPGCASWDQFSNYEQRGHRFEELAKSMRKDRV